jgi:hypothetical protein
MLRIGFSGTNWTGKSESLYRFINEYPYYNVEIVSLSKLVDLCPYPMIEKQTLDGSKWMVEQVVNILENPKEEIQIFDRTPLDILAFTLYASYQTKQQDIDLVREILGLFENFNTIFYVQPSNEWPVDNNKTQNKVSFALLIDFFIRKAIKHLEIEVVSLPWDLSLRQELISEHISLIQANQELTYA